MSAVGWGDCCVAVVTVSWSTAVVRPLSDRDNMVVAAVETPCGTMIGCGVDVVEWLSPFEDNPTVCSELPDIAPADSVVP